MRWHRFLLSLTLSCLLLVLAGCGKEAETPASSEPTVDSPTSPATTPVLSETELASPLLPTATPASLPRDHTPKPDLGIVHGILSQAGDPVADETLYLGPIISMGEEFDVARVDPVSDPRAQTDSSGYFCFPDVPPGRYALGTSSPSGVVFLHGPNGTDIVVDVQAGQVTDLGTIRFPSFTP